jgi:site-specific DNA-methyltransferase (adenine-specific)
VKALPRNKVLVGDAATVITSLPSASVDAVVTSPPYFQLRDYGVDGQLGLEATVDGWVDELQIVFRGLARVLRPTGTVWLNLGDSYSRHPRYGAPAKSLLLGPERVARLLIDDGWTIRNKVIWAKTRSMPTSVDDRLATTWEVFYLLSRSKRYFFDLDAIRVPHRSKPIHPRSTRATYPPEAVTPKTWAGPLAGSNTGLANLKRNGLLGHPMGRNPGDVWSLPSANFRGAHFATFPESLIERPILASVPERVCVRCGVPWRRKTTGTNRGPLTAMCSCNADAVPGVVLDPFMGSGTVGIVAARLRRDWLGIELNPEFAQMAESRITATQPSELRHAA